MGSEEGTGSDALVLPMMGTWVPPSIHPMPCTAARCLWLNSYRGHITLP